MVQTTERCGIIFRELEKARRIILNGTGLEITWAYDDIVFVEHSAYLIRFNDDNTKELLCYFSNDCEPMDQRYILSQLKMAAETEKMTIRHAGNFSFVDHDGEDEIQIAFEEFDND